MEEESLIMWISIVLSILFLAIATIFFTEELREFPMYRSLSFFFLFEGFYTTIEFIVSEIWPNFKGLPMIHNIGGIVFGVYVIMMLYQFKKRKSGKSTVDTCNKISDEDKKITEN